MKKTYIQPTIWVDELGTECPLLGLSRTVTNTDGNGELIYRGGGAGPARAGENDLWDDENDDSAWDQL